MSKDRIYFEDNQTNNKYLLNGIIRDHDDDEMVYGASECTDNSERKFPLIVDLRPLMTPVERQLGINSCVAESIIAACEFLIKKETSEHIDLSRLFLYYFGRKEDPKMGFVIEDKGARPYCVLNTMKQRGCCEEQYYPFEESNVNKEPVGECVEKAKEYKIEEYQALNLNLNEMKTCLANGYPFVFGIALYDKSIKYANNEENPRKGYLEMPDFKSESGPIEHAHHCMLAVGYLENEKHFIVMNSWGDDWGDHGCCYIPYEYMNKTNPRQCFSLFVIKKLNYPERLKPEKDTVNKVRWFWDEGNVSSYRNRPIPSRNPSKNSPAIEKHSRFVYYKERSEDFLILWIDENNQEHEGYVKKFEKFGRIHVDFKETYDDAVHYLVNNRVKIQSYRGFLIICRGYYRNENKNPLDLLKYLDQHGFCNQPIVVFTTRKMNLIKRFDEEAKQKGLREWRHAIEITIDDSDLIPRVKYYIER